MVPVELQPSVACEFVEATVEQLLNKSFAVRIPEPVRDLVAFCGTTINVLSERPVLVSQILERPKAIAVQDKWGHEWRAPPDRLRQTEDGHRSSAP